MTLRRANLISLALIALSFGLVAWFWARLPDPMPTHWNWRGEVDGWTPKPWGPLLLPLVQAGVWLLLAVVPAISPRGYRIDRFGATYGRIVVMLLGFFTVINGAMLAAALGRPVSMSRVVVVLVGALLTGLGNYLGKTTPNFFVGVRTPWTLASPEVWVRTHRLAGWLFVATGVAMMAVGLVTARAPFVVALVALPALVPVVYSYVIYRRIEGFRRDEDER